jgi:hypothetical protein
MATRNRNDLELRAITVSARSALRHANSPDDDERIRTMATELLARLEERVIRNGGDTELLAQIEAGRRALWEHEPET